MSLITLRKLPNGEIFFIIIMRKLEAIESLLHSELTSVILSNPCYTQSKMPNLNEVIFLVYVIFF